MKIDDAIRIFEWDVDYGLLLAENERDSEEQFEALQCMVYSYKHNVPFKISQHRESRSDEWRKAKIKSLKDFIELVARISRASSEENSIESNF